MPSPYHPTMLVLQVETAWWLVLADHTPRYLIHHTPAVHRATGETHIMHRVDTWNLDRAERRPVQWCDGLVAATAWCREQLETPSFVVPLRTSYSGGITVEEQQRRWDAGLDPATGLPRNDETPPTTSR